MDGAVMLRITNRPGLRFSSRATVGGAERGAAVAVLEAVEGVARIALWFGWTLLLLPAQSIAIGLDLGVAQRIPMLYHRGSLRLFRIGLDVHGAISRRRPTLFVANHSSYFDIPILASLCEGSFIAKVEIRGWPLVGLLARLQRSVFIDRRVAATREARDEIHRRLGAGHNLILFPEGTTGDGNRLLGFRSALFGIADAGLAGGGLAVQPVTVAYIRQNGMPIGHANRARFAWFGDMPFAAHFWGMVRAGRLTVQVHFHPPVDAARFGSRKALAAHCAEVIRQGLETALRGRAAA